MGNIEGHDCPPVRDDERQELSLKRNVDLSLYMQHTNGDFGHDCLTELPWELRDSLCLYERINLSFNAVQLLPPELPLRLPHLNYINLNHNRVTSLPESFGLLFHLQTLLMSHNRLKSLPDSFMKLVKLEKVDFSHNLLETLPDTIGTMESLTSVNVADNLLTSLPLSFGLSSTVTLLIATQNDLSSPPQVICDEGSRSTLVFIKKQCSARELLKADTHNGNMNEFARVRGTNILSDVMNPQSAHVQYIQAQTHTTNTTSRIKTPLLPPLESSRFHADELSDRIIGLMYGAAIGDALGLCTKGMSLDEASFHYDTIDLNYTDKVIDETRVRWNTADWTDVFDQTVLVLESILSWAGVVDELDFVRRLQNWVTAGFHELGDSDGLLSSRVTEMVLQNPHFLKDPHSAAAMLLQNESVMDAHKHTNGTVVANGNINQSHASVKEKSYWLQENGALSRSIVLGVPYFYKLSEVEANATRICKATHAAPLCIASGVTLSVLIALMIQGAYEDDDPESIENMIQVAGSRGRAHVCEREEEDMFDEHINICDINKIKMREEHNSKHVLKALSAGITVLRDTRMDFRSAMMSVINQCGDSNVNACIAGALLGCRTGFQRLPKNWVAGLPRRETDWLNCKVNALLDMMGIP